MQNLVRALQFAPPIAHTPAELTRRSETGAAMPLKIHRTAKLAPIDLPDFGTPTVEPGIGDHVYAGRLETFVEKLRTAGADAAVIYADREHADNLVISRAPLPRQSDA